MFKTKTILFLLIIGLITANVIASLNPPTSSSRGTKTYLNYTDMMNETGLRNGSISNITWIGFTPEKVGGILQLCPVSAVNNATLCYNQTSNNLTISYNGGVFHRILDNRTTASPLPNVSLPLSSMNYSTVRSITISYTRDMTAVSGNVTYTGSGFKPTSVDIEAIHNNSKDRSSSTINSDDTFVSLSAYNGGTIGTGSSSGLTIVYIQTADSVLQQANLTSIDNDGITLYWAKTGSPVGTAYLKIKYYR